MRYWVFFVGNYDLKRYALLLLMYSYNFVVLNVKSDFFYRWFKCGGTVGVGFILFCEIS